MLLGRSGRITGAGAGGRERCFRMTSAESPIEGGMLFTGSRCWDK